MQPLRAAEITGPYGQAGEACQAAALALGDVTRDLRLPTWPLALARSLPASPMPGPSLPASGDSQGVGPVYARTTDLTSDPMLLARAADADRLIREIYAEARTRGFPEGPPGPERHPHGTGGRPATPWPARSASSARQRD